MTRRASFQGTSLSAKQRRQLVLDKLVKPAVEQPVDWALLRLDVELRRLLPSEVPPPPADWEKDRYASLEAEFSKYGRTETTSKSAPYVGDMFERG